MGCYRADLEAIYNAKDYWVRLGAWSPIPQGYNTNDRTATWLGLFLADYIPGVEDSGQFAQIGVQVRSYGARWFVYAEAGVYCL